MTLGEMYAHIIVIIIWAHAPRHRTWPTLILIMISNKNNLQHFCRQLTAVKMHYLRTLTLTLGEPPTGEPSYYSLLNKTRALSTSIDIGSNLR